MRDIMKRLIGDRNFYRKVFSVLLPILIQNLITNFVSLLDNIMVGQVGTEPMSGVAIVNQLLFVYNLCALGGLSGAGILTAQYFGKGDHDGIRYTIRVKLLISGIIFFVFGGLLITYGKNMILLFLHEGSEGLDLAVTLHYGEEYLHVMLLQLLPFVVTMMYASTLRETGETLLPMKAGIAAVLVNLVFNYILIFGKLGAPALGVVGAAIATVLARFVEMLLVVTWTHRHTERNRFIVGVFRSLKVPRSVLRQVVLLGMPLLFNELLWSGGMTALNQCYSLRGLEVVSAMNISSTVSNLFFSAFIATGNATSILIGQLLGAGETDRAIDEDRKLIFFALMLSLGVGVLMAGSASVFPQIYNTTEAVKNLARSILLIGAAMMPLHAFANSCYFTLRSGGKALITFAFDSGSIWLLNIPVAFVLSRFTAGPILQMYLIIELLNLVKCVVGYVLVKRKTWVKNLVADPA